MKALGWYSLIWLIFSVLVNMGDSKRDGITRVLSLILLAPIIAYIALNLF